MKIYSYRSMFLWGAISLVFCALYYGSYIQYAMPLTDGWGVYNSFLMDEGRFPYRDFGYYLPPLNLYIDRLIWALSGQTILGYRIIRLIERLIMFQGLYCLLIRLGVTPWKVAVSCIAGCILYSGDPYDLMGDPNQTGDFLILACAAMVYLFERSESVRRRTLLLGVAGVFAGLCFLCRQSQAVALVFCFSVYFAVRCYVLKDKSIMRYVVTAGTGAIIPVALMGFYLYLNDALAPFVDIICSNSMAKGSVTDLFICSWKPLVSLTVNAQHLRADAVALILFCYGFLWFIREESSGYVASAVSSFLFGLIVWYGLQVGCLHLFLFFLCLIVSIGAKWNIHRPFRRCELFLMVGCIVGALWLAGIRFGLLDYGRRLIKHSIYSQLLPRSAEVFARLSFFILGGALVRKWYRRQMGNLRDGFAFAALATGSVASVYAAMMTVNGSSFPLKGFGSVVVMALCWVLSLSCVNQTCLRGFVLIALIVTIGQSYAQKLFLPYCWGCFVETSVDQHCESVDIPELAGLRLDSTQARNITNLIALIQRNSSEDDDLYVFPHAPILNVLAKRHSPASYMAVHFFDVCADDFAIRDAERLRQAPPKVVVWCDLGEPTWLIHEKFFREGHPCGQRAIRSWLSNAIKERKYWLVGSCGNIFVYVRADEDQKYYTYFDVPSQQNATLDLR